MAKRGVQSLASSFRGAVEAVSLISVCLPCGKGVGKVQFTAPRLFFESRLRLDAPVDSNLAGGTRSEAGSLATPQLDDGILLLLRLRHSPTNDEVSNE